MLVFEWVVLIFSLALILLSLSHGRIGLKITPIAYLVLGLAGYGVIGWLDYLLNPLGKSGSNFVLLALGFILFAGIKSGWQDTPLYKILILVFIPIVVISNLMPTNPGGLIQFLMVMVYLLVSILFFFKPKEPVV